MLALFRRTAGSLAFVGSLLLGCPSGLRADAIEDMLRHERESGRNLGVEKLVSAARAGNAAAQAALGRALLDGHYNGIDRAAGLKWIQEAGENGYAYAFDQLGDFYRHGRYVTKDIHEAINWYEKAYAAGVTYASVKLAHAYEIDAVPRLSAGAVLVSKGRRRRSGL